MKIFLLPSKKILHCNIFFALKPLKILFANLFNSIYQALITADVMA